MDQPGLKELHRRLETTGFDHGRDLYRRQYRHILFPGSPHPLQALGWNIRCRHHAHPRTNKRLEVIRAHPRGQIGVCQEATRSKPGGDCPEELGASLSRHDELRDQKAGGGIVQIATG